MKFIAEEVASLGCTVDEIRGFVKIAGLPHLASFTTSQTAHFHWFGVYAEVILAAIDMINAATYLLTQTTYRLAAVIELTARDKVGNRRTTLFQPGFKQPVPAVYSLCFGGHAQCDDFQI